MTPITDKINQLCEKIKKLTPARSSLEHWMTGPDCEGEKEYYGELCTPNEITTLQALVSDLEAKTRALEFYADKSNWYCATNHVHSTDDPECRADTINTLGSGYDIATAALGGGE